MQADTDSSAQDLLDWTLAERKFCAPPIWLLCSSKVFTVSAKAPFLNPNKLMNSNRRRTLVGLLSLTLLSLCFVGCGKKESDAQMVAMDIGGVKVDIPKLQQEFANAPQELQDSVHQAVASVRYGQYERSLQSLDKLVNSPGLTDPQKKLVNNVIEQMKQVIAKIGPSR
jgi:hypothetical protein